jgi:flagellar hook assembly protein FlgD
MKRVALKKPLYALRLDVFPNPFTEKINIRYTIQARPASQGEAGDTRYMTYNIKIYDVSGRLVKDFSRSTTYDVRSTHVVWDGEDEFVCRLPDGVYFVQLETDGFKEIKKVILLR